MSDEIEKLIIDKRDQLAKEIYDFIGTQKKEIYSELYRQLDGLNDNWVKYIVFQIENHIKKCEYRQRQEKEYKYIKEFFDCSFKSNNSRIIVLGIPEHGNIGDQAIVCGEETFLRKNFPETSSIYISWRMLEENIDYLKSKIDKNDIIAIQGGGFLGSLWENEQKYANFSLELFKENAIIIFPQTFWVEEKENKKDKTVEEFRKLLKECDRVCVCLRERGSLQRFEKYYPTIPTMLIPDMAFCNDVDIESNKNNEILLCFRNDKEKVDRNIEYIKTKISEKKYNIKEVSTVCEDTIPYPLGEKYLWKKLKEFSEARLVITDRLHGMIFSALVGTPCIAFDNLSGKVFGVYSYLKLNENIRLVSDEDNFNECFDDMLNKQVNKVVLDDGYFQNLKSFLEKNIHQTKAY